LGEFSSMCQTFITQFNSVVKTFNWMSPLIQSYLLLRPTIWFTGYCYIAKWIQNATYWKQSGCALLWMPNAM